MVEKRKIGKHAFMNYVVNPQRAYPSRQAALDAVRTLIEFIGDDPDRPGLIETPDRVLKAWTQDWGRGYAPKEPSDLVKLFPLDDPLPSDTAVEHQPMVVVKDIAFCSMCEHHMAPFWGECRIGYIPTNKGVVGISKLARICTHFSQRLQVQERLCNQIADFVSEHISPHCAVYMEASHMCMISRGVMQPNATTATCALRGVLFSNPATRQEFFARGS